MRTLGICVIGQAPRPDTEATFRSFLPAGTAFAMTGCLDGLSRHEIADLAPADDADALYTRLPDGDTVTISKAAVVERAPGALARLREAGADVIVFNCTGAFPPLPGDAGVVFPSRLLNGVGAAMVPHGTVGLFVPLAEQIEKLGEKWRREGLAVHAEHLPPEADDDTARAAARRMARHAPDLVVFDCMGYRDATRLAVREVLAVPSLLAITTVGAILREAMG